MNHFSSVCTMPKIWWQMSLFQFGTRQPKNREKTNIYDLFHAVWNGFYKLRRRKTDPRSLASWSWRYLFPASFIGYNFDFFFITFSTLMKIYRQSAIKYHMLTCKILVRLQSQYSFILIRWRWYHKCMYVKCLLSVLKVYGEETVRLTTVWNWFVCLSACET